MKKLKPYLITSLIVLAIFLIIFISKGIFPFGNNSLIWGDMHDQITAFYYHFYDCFRGNASILVDFSSSGGVNFIGVLAYYILSPFSFLVLLVDREKIYLMVSVIVALKILVSSLTCLYFIKTYFKKIPSLLSVLLAIIYAFSGYSLIMYQITPWIDIMCMFPLIMIGLKKVLDLDKPTFYIVTLTLSLIFSFYVSVMVVIFIFLASLIYLLVYQEDKKKRKQAILSLGISTVISLLLASFIVVPAYLQISISSRIGFDIKTLLNSKTGPITDKLSLFLFGGLVYLGILLLLKNYKKHIKFLSFYIPVLLIVLIPAFIEPINKVWHFGSYAFFPYRFGFITMFLLVLGACYSFEHYEVIKGISLKRNKVISVVLTAFISASTFIIMYVNYNDFQAAIETLTISINHVLLLILILSTVVSLVGCFIILLLNKKLDKFSLTLIAIISLTHIIVNSFIYLGIDYTQDELMSQYEELALISKDYEEGNYYRVKNEASNMIMNSSLPMKYHTLDHFTSLTDKNNLSSLKKMGYSSMWVKTFSRGGNLLLDSVLANKYIMTRKEVDSPYYELVKKYDGLYFYELIYTPSYGYLINEDDTIFDKDNSFIITNSIYKNITNSNLDIIEVIDEFDSNNIKITKEKDTTWYDIVDEESYNYLEKDIKITDRKVAYLEILRSVNNTENLVVYESFDIYINDKLFIQNAFDENNNGVLNLGYFEDEDLNIKIVFDKDIDLDNITIGLLDQDKYEEFMEGSSSNTTIKYNKNKVVVDVVSASDKTLFLPINYNEGYKATNNGKSVEVVKVYDNFIGIEVSEGINNIEISFIPKGLVPCLIVSMVTLVVSIILIKTGFYFKILDSNVLANMAYYLYMTFYLLFILVIYVGLTLCFIVSYFKYIIV